LIFASSREKLYPQDATPSDILLYSILTKRKLYLTIPMASAKAQMCLDSCMADDYNEGVENVIMLLRGEK
jgi:hypothetical protein